MHLLPQSAWKRQLSIRSVTLWTHGDGAPGSSAWWTGRDIDRRKDPGPLDPLSLSSIRTTLIVLHPEAMAVPVVMLGHQEPVNITQSPVISTQVHEITILIRSDSPQLLHPIKPPYISAHSTHTPCPVCHSHYWAKPDPVLFSPPFLFSTAPAVPRDSCNTDKGLLLQSKPSGSTLTVLYSPSVTIWFSPLCYINKYSCLTSYLCVS